MSKLTIFYKSGDKTSVPQISVKELSEIYGIEHPDEQTDLTLRAELVVGMFPDLEDYEARDIYYQLLEVATEGSLLRKLLRMADVYLDHRADKS